MFSYYNPAMLPDASKSHVENINNNKAVLPPCHLLVIPLSVTNNPGTCADKTGRSADSELLLIFSFDSTETVKGTFVLFTEVLLPVTTTSFILIVSFKLSS